MTQAEGRNREPSNTGCSTRLSTWVSLNDLPCLAHQGARQRRSLARIEDASPAGRTAGSKHQGPTCNTDSTQGARPKEGLGNRVCSTKGVSRRPTLFGANPPTSTRLRKHARSKKAHPNWFPARYQWTLPNSLRSKIRIIHGKYALSQHPRR